VIDHLVRAYNRAYFDQQLAIRLVEAHREGRRLALLVADADDFSGINDRWGRGTGDAILAMLARRIRSCLVPEDLFARYDGDQFAVLRWCASAERALAFAQRLQSRICNTPFEVDDARDAVFVTVSIGLALGPRRGLNTSGEFTAGVARALYHAKHGMSGKISADCHSDDQ
jgi:two-component system cell cycle response regulator